MIKGLNAKDAVVFLKTLNTCYESMKSALQKWNENVDVSEILEESPWLDEESALISVIEDDVNSVIGISNDLLKALDRFYDKDVSNPKVAVELFFESPFFSQLNSIIKSGIGVDSDTYMRWRGKWAKGYTAINHLIKDSFDVEDYLEGKPDIVYDMYESQYGNLKEFFNSIKDYCDTHPLFFAEVVKDNEELFTKLLSDNVEVSKEDFDAVADAVMPWDVILLKNGDIKMNESYLQRLQRRMDDNASCYNNIPGIVEVMDKLPDNLAKDLYEYEFLVTIEDVEYIKSGIHTWKEIIDTCKIAANKTSYF